MEEETKKATEEAAAAKSDFSISQDEELEAEIRVEGPQRSGFVCGIEC